VSRRFALFALFALFASLTEELLRDPSGLGLS
jgi:hypothetical protein